MTIDANVQQAKGSLSKLLAAAERGEEVYLNRRNIRVVQLVPVDRAAQRQLGFIPGEVSAEAFQPLDASELELWYQ